MDVFAVALCAPGLFVICALIAACVWITSGSPILFRQKRMGRGGRLFTILKFRTMHDAHREKCEGVSAAAQERITRCGAWLRRTKLDELPQLWNVLRGEMSLVGPRPKIPAQQTSILAWRPGVTGAATLAFAQEEAFLKAVPLEQMETLFQRVILPAKQKMDADYMRQATMLSDIALIVNTVLGRWSRVPIAEATFPLSFAGVECGEDAD